MVAAVALAGSAAPVQAMTNEEANAAFQRALAERNRGNLPGVIPQLDPVIAAMEEMQKTQGVYCADNQAQVLIVLSQHALSKDGRNGVIVDNAYCMALFFKGFVLVDLGKSAEAETFLRRAHEAAPLNAQYLNEYAEWHKSVGHWQKAHDLFSEAVNLAEMADKEVHDAYLARALRGMGYTEIELGKLDEAERHMKQSQKYDPDSNAARHELEYIESLRRKAARSTS
jgi:tetratricopeptide (TPR) repeat protein